MTDILLGIIAAELGIAVAYIIFTMSYSAYSVFVLDKRMKKQEEQRAAAYVEMMARRGAPPEVTPSSKSGHYA